MIAVTPRPGLIGERLNALFQRVAAAGGDPSALTVVAVTKGFGAATAASALDAGLSDLGENYAAELAAKASGVGSARWHFLGPVQRNKVGRLAPIVSCWQAVDRPVSAAAIAKHQPGAAVMVQVRLVGDPRRPGCLPEAAGALVDACRSSGLAVRGLMGVGPADDLEGSREVFRRLAVLARVLEVNELSMGMSEDFEVAVAEGSTMIRIGRLLFGPRPGPDPARR